MSNSRAKELTKNIFIVIVGRVSTQVVTFFLLPLYTAFLTTKEYGIVDLIATLVQLFIPIMSMMIDQGVFRYLLKCELENDKKKIISSAFFLLCIGSAVVVALYMVVSIFVTNQYKLWLLLILIVTAFSNLFLQIARGLRHTGDYALGSFVCSASTIILNIFCIVTLKMGAIGMLIAIFAGNVLCSLFLFFKLKVRRYIVLSAINKTASKSILKYSIPLVPNQLSIWVMNSSDRIIVTFFLGAAANGILALSHKFPAIYMTFFNIFLLAWHETGAIHYFDADRDEFFSDMFRKIVTIFSTLCMMVIIVVPIVFDWFVNQSYQEAYYNIPIYMIASLFNVVVGVLGVVYVATEKTLEIAKTTIVAAIINVVVNVILIKFIGLYAASISTFVGYFATLIYRIADTKKYLKIRYDLKQFIGMGSTIVICCFIYYINNKMISLIVFPIVLIVVYSFNKDIFHSLMSIVVEKIGNERFIKYKKVIIIGIIIIGIAYVCGIGGYVYNKTINGRREIQTSEDIQIDNLVPKNIIKFSQFGAKNFTCTGVTFDTHNNTYWIMDCGLTKGEESSYPHIIEINQNFNEILNEIDISKSIKKGQEPQGLSYDTTDNMFWVATGDSIIEIDKNGELFRTIPLARYSNYKANGVCYDASDDTLWVLCLSKYIIRYSKGGDVLKIIEFDYAYQDHIIRKGDDLLITVGADYKGDDNFVCQVSVEDGKVKKLYRVLKTYAIEGICFNKKDLIICNDGLYHDAKIKESYISVFNNDDLDWE